MASFAEKSRVLRLPRQEETIPHSLRLFVELTGSERITSSVIKRRRDIVPAPLVLVGDWLESQWIQHCGSVNLDVYATLLRFSLLHFSSTRNKCNEY